MRQIVDSLSRQFAEAWDAQGIAEDEVALLRKRAGNDQARFSRWLKRRLCGDPVAYIVGDVSFMGRHFRMDRRAHVTDPETEHLVKAALGLLESAADDAVVAEVGVGAGTLGLTLLLERPGTRLVGLDLDASALALCRENARLHRLDPELIESDMLVAWGTRPEPALVFGDLPWGDQTTLYDTVRDCRHYLEMPPAAAFPLGDRIAAHRELLRQVADRGWRCPVLLNCGTLPTSDIHRMSAGLKLAEIQVLQPLKSVRLLLVPAA